MSKMKKNKMKNIVEIKELFPVSAQKIELEHIEHKIEYCFKNNFFEYDEFDNLWVNSWVVLNIIQDTYGFELIKININKLLSIYDLFGITSKMAYHDIDKSKKLLDICDTMIYLINDNLDVLFYLKDAIFAHIFTLAHCEKETEINGIQERFKDSIKDLIPNAKIVDDYKFNRSNVPDFMVDINGSIRPVEIKKEKATGLAVKQILRYVDFYRADKGYLVAPELRAGIPGNIIYIKFN